MNVSFTQPDSGVTVFRFEPKNLKNGQFMKILNCSDIHLDSKLCDRELLKKHCEEADYIKIIGDLFDLMQGRNDKRRSEGTLEIEGDKAKFPNADIVMKGHNHFKWHNPGQTRYCMWC